MIDLQKPLRVLVQGITGKHGQFHTREMIAAGTNIVAGTSPNKAGDFVFDVPVFATIAGAKKSCEIDVSVIFVPPAHAKLALIEAVENDIKLIVCVTEGIPVHNFLAAKKLADAKNIMIIGPNCPGILIPGVNKLGIIPAAIGRLGDVAIVSKSGTLTYEVADALTRAGIGQRYVIGIGGDPVKGASFVDCLRMFEADPGVRKIVLIGEIGGHDEQIAADFIAKNVTKPVFAYVAGHHAPIGKQLGHAGAIIGNNNETAAAKTAYLAKNKIETADTLDGLIMKIRN